MIINNSFREGLNQLSIDDNKYSIEYLKLMHSNLADVENRLNWNIFYLVCSIIIFFLFDQTAIASVSIGPFGIKDLDFIYKIIPVIISLFYFNIFSQISYREIYLNLYHDLLEKMNQDNDNSLLDIILLPYSFFLPGSIISKLTKRKFNWFITFFRYLMGFILLILPALIIIYSIIICYSKYGFKDIVLYLGSFIAFIFCLQGFTLFYKHNKL